MLRGQHCSLVLLLAVVSTACVREPAKPSAGSSAAVFRPALIRVAAKTANVVSALVRIEDSDGVLVSVPFTGHEEARRLEDAFLGLRDGTRSPVQGAWIGFAVVEFRYEDGSVESILTDFEDWMDSDRRESTVSKGTAEQVAKKLPPLDAVTLSRVFRVLRF